jgi:flagellar basal body-associated protein FliL
VVEIIVLMSNGVVFQNEYMSDDAKNAIGAIMILVIVCLTAAGISGEFSRRVAAFKKKRHQAETEKPQTTAEMFPTIAVYTTTAPQF